MKKRALQTTVAVVSGNERISWFYLRDEEAYVIWVLHIAKVGSIPLPYLGNVDEQ